MNYFSSDFTLGILGGGQLGKMLLTETRKFDIATKVMDAAADAPARFATNEFVRGDLLDYDAVYHFGKGVDVLTFEIENVNVAALEQLEREGVKVYPTPQSLNIIQNKASQKLFYEQHQIPTAPFQVFEDLNQLKQAAEKGEVTFPFVWKSARFGYDGNGVKVVRSLADLQQLPQGQCLAEMMIPFKNELAVIVVRSPKGEMKTYPVVEMEFHPEANQVEYVICPARIPDEIAQKAQAVALQVADAFNSVGLLAVEMFQTQNDEILVNEVAPRPHNSGHYSIEASYTNQFEQHLRAILNLPLGATESKVAGVMVNLVGEEGFQGDVVYQNIEQIMAMEGVTPHIYGKRQTRPFRKMGHVTIVNPNLSKAREIAQEVKQTIRVVSNNKS
ncbi:AIR carboxylase [Capnocytophaga canimorsus]|uniref:N5-carboxyaminoimidazole ribonucleotide synthase n=1 Tax=Capnocytophaga canimorsus TaxID=28188 RepID=A0A0B7HKY4_9FLAO|nr:5-(carboxyamino)imidazole ribonucleotide synthase [Capnocytophaga canimorsus]ATA77293.1 5-(carboxyamino)imidazole ribonucleotide synthase [Capnocytophaga canimorsus]PJI83544.1 5-(carboxyamino)imidazole ribonucleotide synthase [Capnocytophaga canimorsus]CEN39304.1 AIR carboxylase [Capnocytophaga canimorsus]STA72533.1 N5-carboxyaminoimidazole ribonucleotide synthase [Capnocytophaga canimorsus]